MKISARNQFRGRVTSITPGAVTGTVRMKVSGDFEITSSITNEAIQDLGLAIGDEVTAIIKASDVVVGK